MAQLNARPPAAHDQQLRYEVARPQRVWRQQPATIDSEVRRRRDQQASQLFGR